MHGKLARALRLGLLSGAVSLQACSSVKDALLPPERPQAGQQGAVSGFLGGVVADEPQAALTGRAILSAGGNAADAAVAMGFTLSVTLPSRAGLGASGGCLAYGTSPKAVDGGVPAALLFPPIAASSPGADADRPASVPMLARGLFALQARFGSQPIETLISPAEQVARFGMPVSRALLADITSVAGPLSADPEARGVFFLAGQPLPEGSTLLQPDLAATLSQLRNAGIGDLYQGVMAKRLVAQMQRTGGGLTLDDLRTALPRFAAPLLLPGLGDDRLAVLPLPFDGGIATAGALQVLGRDASGFDEANTRALGLAAAVRAGATDATALLTGATAAPAIGPLPASTSFAALDRAGNAVVCSVSMGNLFGTGRIARGTGILLGASPKRLPQPILASVIAWNPRKHAFHALAAGAGQQGAPVAAAMGLLAGLGGHLPAVPPEPGRANVIACPGYLPDENKSCIWSTDPRGFGLAAGSN